MVEMDCIPEMKRYYIVIDNAPIHTSKDIDTMVTERGYKCIYLPAYSPELNPIEKFWFIVKNKVKRSQFQTKEDLCTRITKACNSIPPEHHLRAFVKYSVILSNKIPPSTARNIFLITVCSSGKFILIVWGSTMNRNTHCCFHFDDFFLRFFPSLISYTLRLMANNHRYEQVSLENHDDESHHIEEQNNTTGGRPSSTMSQQQSDLQDTFDINEEDEDNQLLETEYHQLLPAPIPSSSGTNHFSNGPIQQQSNDGVFSNMAAKPESDSKLEQVPPTYEEASADATPPYWQTTIIAPAGMGDMVLVEGLPVGSIFSFLWNLMVSASFQLVGFMLTYLLHTTHAAKDGARAGLGVSLIQYGFYVRSRGTLDEDFDYDGEGHDTVGQDATQADVVAYLMMLVGWFIILRAVSDFTRARKMEKIITSEPNVDAIV